MNRATRLLAVASLLILTVSSAPRAVSPSIVISQIYGGGGNSGATLTNDFIELYNRGDVAVDVTGWTVQYAASTGATWQTTALSGTIAPGKYYLVQESAGTGGSAPLPTPDAVGRDRDERDDRQGRARQRGPGARRHLPHRRPPYRLRRVRRRELLGKQSRRRRSRTRPPRRRAPWRPSTPTTTLADFTDRPAGAAQLRSPPTVPLAGTGLATPAAVPAGGTSLFTVSVTPASSSSQHRITVIGNLQRDRRAPQTRRSTTPARTVT